MPVLEKRSMPIGASSLAAPTVDYCLQYVMSMVPTLVFWECQFWQMKSRPIGTGHLAAPATVCCLLYGMSMVPTLVFCERQFWQMKSRPVFSKKGLFLHSNNSTGFNRSQSSSSSCYSRLPSVWYVYGAYPCVLGTPVLANEVQAKRSWSASSSSSGFI
jgi:hypothetical protein